MRLFLFFILLSLNIYSQGTFSCGYNHSSEPTLCDFVGKQSYISNQLVLERINKMVSSIALPQNFILVECNNINNAFAYVKNGTRYILIDDSWIKSIEGNNWFISGILAHEIGHHLCGHTVNTGYVTLEDKRKRELEADKFAGFILKSIGATKDQALVAINSLVPVDFDDNQSSHPTKFKRVEAINSGYNKLSTDLDGGSLSQNSNINNAEILFNKAISIVRYPSFDTDKKTLVNASIYCEKAIELNPNFMDAYFHLGLIYQSLGRSNKKYYDMSFSNYNRALKIEPNSSGIYNNVGMLYSQYGYDYVDYNSYIKAINCYNTALKLDPESGEAYLNRGIAYLNIGFNFRKPTLPKACEDFYKACSLGEPKGCYQYKKACNL